MAVFQPSYSAFCQFFLPTLSSQLDSSEGSQSTLIQQSSLQQLLSREASSGSKQAFSEPIVARPRCFVLFCGCFVALLKTNCPEHGRMVSLYVRFPVIGDLPTCPGSHGTGLGSEEFRLNPRPKTKVAQSSPFLAAPDPKRFEHFDDICQWGCVQG